jgi:hypothetical protein
MYAFAAERFPAETLGLSAKSSILTRVKDCTESHSFILKLRHLTRAPVPQARFAVIVSRFLQAALILIELQGYMT